MTSRVRALALTSALALVLAATLAACGGSHPAANHATTPPVNSATVRGLDLPATGAVLGAYVKAADKQPATQIAAFQSLEHATGYTLGIVHTYDIWTVAFPTPVETWALSTGHTPLISWNTIDTLQISNGSQDAWITARAQALKALDHPVLLEYRWEMDRPDLAGTVHSAADYIAAWDHIHAIFTKVGATNVGFVWCPTAYGFAQDRAQAYYPGDDEVDWIGADAYGGTSYTPLSTTLAPFLSWAAGHAKPVIIGEFGADVNAAGSQASWISQLAAEAPAMPSIRAYVYFDSMFSATSDIAIDTPGSLAAFTGLLKNPYFHAMKSS